MKKYSTIIFDLDGTLRLNRPGEVEAYVMFLAEHGLHLISEQVRAGERWAHAYWANTSRVESDLARYDEESFWLSYTRWQLEALGIQDAEGHLIQSVCAAFKTRYQPEACLAPSAHQVLNTLRAQGYRLGLVSNRVSELSPLVVELGLEEYFAFTLASEEIGVWKPDPRIFLHACQMGGCAPEASVYVGDNYYADVVGAQAARLTPVLYDPRDVFPEVMCVRIADLSELLEWLGISVVK